MKNLIYKNEKFYLCDEKDSKNGQTCLVSKYIASDMNMPHKQFKNKIVIYARPTCPYCIEFLDYLKKNNTTTGYYNKLIYVEVDSDSPDNLFSKNNILKNLKTEINTHSTVPIVFHNGKFIGGSDTSKEYFGNIKAKSK
jgi:glutaredoxin